MIGYSSERIAVSGTIQAEGEVIPPRNLAAITRAANYDDYSDVYLDECQAGGTCVVPSAADAWIAFNDVRWDPEYRTFEAQIMTGQQGGQLRHLFRESGSGANRVA